MTEVPTGSELWEIRWRDNIRLVQMLRDSKFYENQFID